MRNIIYKFKIKWEVLFIKYYLTLSLLLKNNYIDIWTSIEYQDETKFVDNLSRTGLRDNVFQISFYVLLQCAKEKIYRL